MLILFVYIMKYDITQLITNGYFNKRKNGIYTGFIVRYERLENYVNKYKKAKKKEYEEKLLGKKVVSFSEIKVFYHIKNIVVLDKNTVVLDNGQIYEIHYRWATDEKESLDKEIPENGQMTMKEYYNKYALNKTIIKVEVGYERDDYVYVYAYLDNTDAYIEIL